MEIFKYKNIDKFNNILIAFVIFANIIQNALYFSLNIRINIFYQYIIIILLISINKLKIHNKSILIFVYIVILIFNYNMIFFLNDKSILYFKNFILYGFPVICCFVIKIDFKSLSKTMVNFSSVISLFYIISIFTNQELIKFNYMTWGFDFVFCINYIYIYLSIIKKKKIIANIIFILGTLLLLSFGNKSSILILLFSFVIISFYNKSKLKKSIYGILLILISLNWRTILYLIVNFLNEKFTLETYSINSFLVYLKQDFSTGFLGSRTYIYENSIYEIKKNIFGMGIGGFESIHKTYPHNIILDLMVTFGVLIGGVIILMVIYLSIKSFKNIDNKFEYIFYIFVFTNLFKLFFSKSFSNDIIFWLYLTINILIKFRRKIENNSIYTNIQQRILYKSSI